MRNIHALTRSNHKNTPNWKMLEAITCGTELTQTEHVVSNRAYGVSLMLSFMKVDLGHKGILRSQVLFEIYLSSSKCGSIY